MNGKFSDRFHWLRGAVERGCVLALAGLALAPAARGGVSVAVPSLTKSFSSPIIGAAGTTALTFTVTNPAGAPAVSNVGFVDTLPSGLIVANPPAVGGTCANAAAATTASAGGSTVAVTFLQVPSGVSSCTVTVNVTNKTGQTNADCNLNPAAFTNFSANLEAVNAVVSSEPACLVVNSTTGPPPAPQVPALSGGMLGVLAGSLAAAGIFLARRRAG